MEANELGRLRIRGTTDGLATVLPIFLRYGSNTGAYKAGYEYKTTSPAEHIVRTDAQLFMFTMARTALSHERCIARHLSLQEGSFEAVTWIPSKQGRPEPHPMSTILHRAESSNRVESLLTYTYSQSTGHEAKKDMWLVKQVDGRLPSSVLVVDDTWTFGASLLSASYALLDAGVKRVGLVVLGRHISPWGANRSPNAIFENYSAEQTWSAKYCAFCDTRSNMRPEPSLMNRYQSQEAEVVHVEASVVESAEALEIRTDVSVFGRRMLSTKYGLGTVEDVSEDMLLVQFGHYGLRKVNISRDDFEWL
jgi:hypothetical protein